MPAKKTSASKAKAKPAAKKPDGRARSAKDSAQDKRFRELEERVEAVEHENAHIRQVFIKRFSIDPAELEYREEVSPGA